MRHYCTYFDHRYLPRGVAMGRSLIRYAPDSTIWALCLSDSCYDAMRELSGPNWRLIYLADFESGDEGLLAAKRNRSTIEYYFTCTPSLVRYVQKQIGTDDTVTYLDSDLWFFSSPEPAYDEMGDKSVAITPHRFPPQNRHKETYGRYNVGWLTFRNDACGTACAGWGRERCLEWCYDRGETGRMGDQGYLAQFAELFGRVHEIQHLGVNFAPWNVLGHQVETAEEGLLIDGQYPLVVFHFHGLRRIGARRFMTPQAEYGCPLSPSVRHLIYQPYLAELLSTEADAIPFVD